MKKRRCRFLDARICAFSKMISLSFWLSITISAMQGRPGARAWRAVCYLQARPRYQPAIALAHEHTHTTQARHAARRGRGGRRLADHGLARTGQSFHRFGEDARARAPGRGGHGLYPQPAGRRAQVQSEEHTSELQSQSNLVCRLLLEKKKKQKYNISTCSE